VALFILVWISLTLVPALQGPGLWRAYPSYPAVDGWCRWDAGWYQSIVEHGYTNGAKTPTAQRDTYFWPLYPLVVRLLNIGVGNSYLSALLVSNLSFLISLILLFRIAERRYGKEVATKGIILLSLYPFSFYFSAYYSESLYLLTCVAAFFFGEQRRWILAGLCAAGAAATRLTGSFVMFGLALLYLEQINFSLKRVRSDICWILLGFLGPLAFSVFLWQKFGDPFVFYSGRNILAEAANITLSGLYGHMGNLIHGRIAITEINILFGLLGLGVVLLACRRIGAAYSLWAIASLLVGFSNFLGMGRYVAPVFPVFFAGAMLLRSEGPYLAWACFSTLLLALFTFMFSHWYWVA
jgi:hypothetical protein